MRITFARTDLAAICSVAFLPTGHVGLRVRPKGPIVTALALSDYQPDLLPVQVPGWRLSELGQGSDPYVQITLVRWGERSVMTVFSLTAAESRERRLAQAIGRSIRRRRRAARLSPERLAACLNHPFPHIIDLETGRRTVWPDLLWDVAHLFGLAPGEIIDEALPALRGTAASATEGTRP